VVSYYLDHYYGIENLIMGRNRNSAGEPVYKVIHPDKDQLRLAIKTIGPTAVAIDASGDAFRNYDGSYIYGYSPFEPN